MMCNHYFINIFRMEFPNFLSLYTGQPKEMDAAPPATWAAYPFNHNKECASVGAIPENAEQRQNQRSGSRLAEKMSYTSVCVYMCGGEHFPRRRCRHRHRFLSILVGVATNHKISWKSAQK